MARYFVGENNSYPRWTRGSGRWVIQRVLITWRGVFGETSVLARPDVSDEWLIWAPRHRGIKTLLLPMKVDEATRAVHELQYIPLVCGSCDWTGSHPHIEVNLLLSRGPADWRLRCPSCRNIARPDIDSTNQQAIIERWLSQGKPALDHPGAGVIIESPRPIDDLEEWIQNYHPIPNELAYVGQQLWSSFAEFIIATKRTS